MRTLFIAAASALFFAAVITELSMRLWPGEYFPLLLLAFVALLLSGLLTLRLAGWLGTAATAPVQRRGRPGVDQQSRQRKHSRQDDKRGNSQAPAAAEREPASAIQHQPEPPPSDAPRETGTVKWFNRTKGFGFVIRESGEEIFVHQRSIRPTGEGENRRRPSLKDGQSVTFVVARREKGLQAEDVVPVE